LKNQSIYDFSVADPLNADQPIIGYTLSADFESVDVNVVSMFAVMRDSLVARGYLKHPFTDTKEYRDIIRNNILYWKNGSWLKQTELDNKIQN
jgi:hypothetical protein